MQALELRDNALQWETERQNRILQSAAEQKKKQMRLEAVQREQSPVAKPDGAGAIQLSEWVDKVSTIPDIRSALIPLEDEEASWSKPFSLAKADMEPWLSFYRGYRQSRLFLNAEPAESSIDYPVRALLELKRAHTRLIIEPPVQINGQVEYFDTEAALSAGHDSGQFRAMLRGAILTHDKQLKLAEQKGRDMGDALHDALMGEGHANLIKAWERVYQRKPTVEELHQMLTAGRVKVSSERKPVSKPEANEVRQAMAEMIPSATLLRQEPDRRMAHLVREIPVQLGSAPLAVADDDNDGEEAVVTLSSSRPKDDQRNSRKYLWLFIHTIIGCAALAAYIFVF